MFLVVELLMKLVRNSVCGGVRWRVRGPAVLLVSLFIVGSFLWGVVGYCV